MFCFTKEHRVLTKCHASLINITRNTSRHRETKHIQHFLGNLLPETRQPLHSLQLQPLLCYFCLTFQNLTKSDFPLTITLIPLTSSLIRRIIQVVLSRF